MTMALPQPMPAGNRPAYLDNLFNRNSSGNASISSSISSTSTISLTPSVPEIKSPFSRSRTFLSPTLEDTFDDGLSMRSKRSFLAPRRFKLGRLFSRRVSPQFEIQEINHEEPIVPISSPPLSEAPSPTMSVQRTSFPKSTRVVQPPVRGESWSSKTPVVIIPSPPSTQELSCDRCYYFAARNCNGWVMGGSSGDACETCLQAGFFGAK